MVLVSPWAAPSLLAAALTLGLLVYVQRRRPPRPLLPSLSGALLGAALFAAGDAVSGFLTRDPRLHQIAIAALYTGALMLGPSVWRLAIRFSELHGEALPWASSRLTLLPRAWSLAMWPVVVTNPWHELFVSPRVGERSGFNALWYANATELHLVILASALLFVRLARRAQSPNVRVQARLMAAALFIPALGNLVYVVPSTPPPFDPTSLGLLATSILFIAGIYHSRLFALEPIDFAELMRQESDGVLLVDPDGRLLVRNAASAAWLPPDVAARDVLYPVLAGRLAAADGSPLDAARLALELGGDEQPPGGRLYRNGTDPIWVRIESTPIRDERGRLRCRSLRLRDETPLRWALAEAEQQASVLAGVFAATEEGILVHMDGRIRLVNDQFHEIWRTPPEARGATRSGDLIGVYLPDVVNRDVFLASVETVWRDPRASIRDEVLLRDGRVLERISVPLLSDGKPIGRVWRVRDVTEQRRSEEAVRHAQKIESLGVLAGGIAHDFNNLLVAILGNASLARSELGRGGTPIGDYLADLERAAVRASELTRQLLDFAGRSALQFAELDVSRIAREIVDLAAVSISKQIELHVDLAEGLPAVAGDASQIRQVAMNLILNAADAVGETEGGSISVTTELAVLGSADGDGWIGQGVWRPGRYVAMRVSDTGCGMTDEVRASIFDPFFTTKVQGRGLGLAASLGIVRSHDGFVRVRSQPGAGSEFTVLLPAGDAPAPAPVERAAAPAWRSDATVLVVDDEPAVASVASRMLASAGMRVIVAHDGEEALAVQRTARGAIDLVLLDLNMPGLAGDGVFRALRRKELGLRILLSSGYPEREALARLADAGPIAFVAKPYTREELLERVRAVLEGP